MDLFNSNTEENILPYDGEAVYFGSVFSGARAKGVFEDLLSLIAWEHDQVKLFGKVIVTKRKVAWYGDEPYDYTYSNATKTALPWTPLLLDLKSQAERLSHATYNSCLMNLYHDGSEGMAWHSDDEKTLEGGAAIASLSFGASRKFAFKHKTSGVKRSVILESGSLLVMRGPVQQHWQHRLPPTKKVLTPRINLTFRSMLQ